MSVETGRCRSCGATVQIAPAWLPHRVIIDHPKPVTGTWCGGSQMPPAPEAPEPQED